MPLNPQSAPAIYASRRLDDPKVAQFLVDRGISALDTTFTPAALGVVAVFFRPDVAVARAAVRSALAGEMTAGQRAASSTAASVERVAASSDRNASPWTWSWSAGLTIETGGKRDARVVRAQAVTLGAVRRAEATEWQVAQDARQAAIAAVGADGDVADAEAELVALRGILELLRARYAEGAVSLADVAQAELDVQAAVVALGESRRSSTAARSTLARALGVSLDQSGTIRMRPPPTSGCEAADAASTDGRRALDASALQHRVEVGSALADYAVAEAELRLAVARQYPDLTIGPGIAWDQGVGRWVLAAGSSAIPSNRNRGPITEADAQRAVQATRVQVVEDSVLAQVHGALSRCLEEARQIVATDALVAATVEQQRLREAAFARGEIGRTAVAFARLAAVRARRLQRQATHQRYAAGALLEAATGRWAAEPNIRWPGTTDSIKRDAAAGSPMEHRE